MRWSSTADHILLVKILETGGFNVDTVKVAEAWPEPTDGEQPPTPRAIKERISKIRELLKQAGIDVAGSSSSNKRSRVKKAGSSKTTTPGSKAPSRGRKNKRQTAAADPKDPAEDPAVDNAEEGAESEDLPDVDAVEDKDEDPTDFDDDV